MDAARVRNDSGSAAILKPLVYDLFGFRHTPWKERERQDVSGAMPFTRDVSCGVSKYAESLSVRLRALCGKFRPYTPNKFGLSFRYLFSSAQRLSETVASSSTTGTARPSLVRSMDLM